MNKYFVAFFFIFGISTVQAQLDVNVEDIETSMVKDDLLGGNVSAMNVRYTGHIQSRASFTNENTVLSFENGVVLSSGYVTTIAGRNKSSSFSGSMGKTGDLDLARIASGETFDAAVLEFDFVASQEVVSFRYAFASEEYPEYVNSQFNDVFAFYLTDKITKETWNLATIPTTTYPITINTINDKWNFKYYISNLPEDINKYRYDLEMLELDGITKPLVAFHKVKKGRPYHIKIAICDVGDPNLDSSVFIEGGSFVSQTEEEFYSENSSFINSFEETKNKSKRTEALSNNDSSVAKTTSKLVESKNHDSAAIEPVSITFYFDTDKHTLSNQEAEKIELLSNSSFKKLKVIGYTDSVGSTKYNYELSEKRAREVSSILKQKFKLDCQISWEGEQSQINNNSTEKDKALNRRVVVSSEL